MGFSGCFTKHYTMYKLWVQTLAHLLLCKKNSGQFVWLLWSRLGYLDNYWPDCYEWILPDGFETTIHNPEGMMLNDFGDQLTVHLVPPSGISLWHDVSANNVSIYMIFAVVIHGLLKRFLLMHLINGQFAVKTFDHLYFPEHTNLCLCYCMQSLCSWSVLVSL